MGPIALDGLPPFLHFIQKKIAPRKTSRSTNAERAIIAIVLVFIFWFLFPNFAVIGRSPALDVGPLPIRLPYGGEEGIPDNELFDHNLDNNYSEQFLIE